MSTATSALNLNSKKQFRNGHCCGRDDHRWSPPAQNRTSGFPAYGSHLGGLTRGATTRTPPNPWNTLSPHCVE